MSPSYYPGIGNLYTVASVKGGDIYILNTLDLYEFLFGACSH